MEITFNNFMNATLANYNEVNQVPNRNPDFQSNNRSFYWYEGDSVIRKSDHWGSDIRTCSWFLDSASHSGHYVEEDMKIGICKLQDFIQKKSYLTLKKGDKFSIYLVKSGRLNIINGLFRTIYGHFRYTDYFTKKASKINAGLILTIA